MVNSRSGSIKKKKALALVLACALAVGLTGMYAKYITSHEHDDTARVAKWGITVSAKDGDMFKSNYALEDQSVTDLGDGAFAVSGASSAKVVAPGTKGSFAGLSITGKPEVAVKVSNEGTFSLSGWTITEGEGQSATSSYYCPIVVKVTDPLANSGAGETTSFYGLDYESMTAFAAAVNAKIGSFSKNYTAGTDLSSDDVVKAQPQVSWEWAFTSTSGTKVNASDARDTLLGNLATAPTISYKQTLTVTQID